MNLFEDWLGTGLAATLAATASVLMVAVLMYVALRRALLPLVARAARHTALRWDDLLIDRRVQRWLALLLPAVLVHLAAPAVPGLNDFWTEFWFRVTAAATIFTGTWAVSALLMAFNPVYETLPISRERPIKGYLQVLQIVAYIFGDIWLLSVLTNQSPWYFLSGLGAAAAVLLLLYRDTILSLVASVQLAQNDMLRVGDWIEMPQFNADGTVIDMALATVKVQNWDKTITTIPTHRLTSESFKNWRGMKEAGSRRIKRSINLDISSIRFLTDEEAERYAHTEPLVDYLSAERDSPAESDGADRPTELVTGDPHRSTNVDALHDYLIAHLIRHPDLATDTMPFLVRQLPPGPHGLPLEIYVFSRGTRWKDYEAIQGNIVGHVLAVLPQFDLRAFQEPTDSTIRSLSAASVM